MDNNILIVSEYVSFGHPDKIADQISDAIVDEFIRQDKNARTGIEVMVKDNVVVLGGEVNSTAEVDYEKIIRKVYSTLDFSSEHHLSPENIKIINLIGKQSPEIHQGVDTNNGIAAGDQGFMVGMATNETSVYMPLGHYIAKKICNYVSTQDFWGPDAKTQVIIKYDCYGKPVGIHNILVSTMHQCSLDCVREEVRLAIKNNKVGIDKGIYDSLIKNSYFKIDVNPCGEWRIGGPVSDCGVTGRKIVVDAYGGYCNVGGGAFSGKDYSKVDRSAAYMARYLAKNIVASGFCDTARVTLSYMIGVAYPCSIEIDVNRNHENLDILKIWLRKNVDFTPDGIIKRFGIQPIMYECAKYGHFGFPENDIRPWEHLDLAESIATFVINNA